MKITNIQRNECHEDDDQVAYDVILTIDNTLIISGIQILYTYADSNNDPYYIKWPEYVQFFNNSDIFSIEEQILRGLDKVPMKEKLLHDFKTDPKGRFAEELIKIIKEKL